jgi:hypothetical protein
MAVRTGLRLGDRTGTAVRRARVPGPVRVVAILAVFVAAFMVSRTVIGAAAPIRPAGSHANDVYHKVEFLREHLGEYDVVYVGSSRARRAFDPAVFDATLAEQGIAVRSFNLGLPGLAAFGQDHVVRDLLEEEGAAGLRLLILAPDDFEARLTAERARTDRQVLWHDLGRTAQVLRLVAQSTPSVREKAVWSWHHLNAFLLHATTSGRLSERASYRVRKGARRVLGPRGDGYLPNPAGEHKGGDRARGVARVAAQEARPAPPPAPAARDLLASLAGAVRARGIDVVFVREPALVIDRSRALRWIAANDPSIPAADLGDPGVHPELFDPDLYFDPGHLNAAGATLFSALLAAEVAPLLHDR